MGKSPHGFQNQASRSYLNIVRDLFIFILFIQTSRDQNRPNPHSLALNFRLVCIWVKVQAFVYIFLIPNSQSGADSPFLGCIQFLTLFSAFASHSCKINLLFIYCVVLEKGSNFSLLPIFRSGWVVK